jgi:hypothetical protein
LRVVAAADHAVATEPDGGRIELLELSHWLTASGDRRRSRRGFADSRS